MVGETGIDATFESTDRMTVGAVSAQGSIYSSVSSRNTDMISYVFQYLHAAAIISAIEAETWSSIWPNSLHTKNTAVIG